MPEMQYLYKLRRYITNVKVTKYCSGSLDGYDFVTYLQKNIFFIRNDLQWHATYCYITETDCFEKANILTFSKITRRAFKAILTSF